MPKMLCSTCEVEFKCHKNGVKVIEHADFGPYKLWDADEWVCPKCGFKVVAGFGQQPMAEHWEDHFDRWMTNVAATPELIRNDFER